MHQYQVKSPVLFLIFNRPDVTAHIFNQIKKVKPSRLYIAADGPRPDRLNEAELCEQAKAVLTIDWDCDVKTLYRTENLGCRMAVSSAVTWFFENEEEGIILEDDCLPAISFFSFCDQLLDIYRNDTRIRHIAGCNFQQSKQWGSGSYYFTNLTHVWGWASWRRVWQDYDVELRKYSNEEVQEQLGKIFTNSYIVESWTNIFKDMKAQKIDTWDYQLTLINFFNNALNIIPNVNLISNLGFGTAATHTSNAYDPKAKLALGEVDTIIHPKYFLPEKQADMFTLNADFNVDERIKKDNTLNKRFKRWLKK